MSFDSSIFRKALRGGSRANLFKVEISGGNAPDEEKKRFSHTCKAAALPGSTLGLIEIPFNGGRRYKLAGERTFGDWTTTVINTEGFEVRSALEEWQKGIVGVNFDSGTVGNRNVGTDNALANVLLRDVHLLVSQLDDNGETVVQYQLHHCWPSDISTIDLSYDNADSIEEFTVTWSYDYFTQVSPTGVVE